MYSMYGGYDANFALHTDDINAIQYLYGERNVQKIRVTKWTIYGSL